MKKDINELVGQVNMPALPLCKILECSYQSLANWTSGRRPTPDRILLKLQDIRDGLYEGNDRWRTVDTVFLEFNWYICMVGHVTTVFDNGDASRKSPNEMACPCKSVNKKNPCGHIAYSMEYPTARPIPYSIPAPTLDWTPKGFKPTKGKYHE